MPGLTRHSIFLVIRGLDPPIHRVRGSLSERERAENKAGANYAIQILGQAVDSLMFVAGSGAFNNSNPAARYWRDFNMLARHFGNIPNVGFEVLGRSILGVTPNAVPPHMY